MSSDELIRAAVEALELGDWRSASDRYESAAQVFLENGEMQAAAIHLALAAQYEKKKDARAEYLLRRAQEIYVSESSHDKVVETLLLRAARAMADGHEGRAEQLFVETIAYSAERLATIARHCLEIQGLFCADPEADALIDQIVHSCTRLQALRSQDNG